MCERCVVCTRLENVVYERGRRHLIIGAKNRPMYRKQSDWRDSFCRCIIPLIAIPLLLCIIGQELLRFLVSGARTPPLSPIPSRLQLSFSQTTRINNMTTLYAGESLDTIAGFSTIYHYQPARAENARERNPLIVCVPGGLHLARVFYGGHPGSKNSDFVSHWLSENGYGVLSLSYPLETDPEIMPPTGARFRIRDWGRQAAATTKKIIDEQDLGEPSIVLISWSMGGRMVVPFNIAAKELGLHVQQYISFAATPGFSTIRPPMPGLTCTDSGYFQVPPRLDNFERQLSVMDELNGRTIIPRDIYRREYVGATPINLIGLGLKYDGSGFVRDEIPHEEDSQVLNVANLPFITALHPTSILDATHAMTDRAGWGFLMTYSLESMIGKHGLRKANESSKWDALLNHVQSAPTKLCLPIRGNHFFFIGEQSARDTAWMVDRLIREADDFQSELQSLIA